MIYTLWFRFAPYIIISVALIATGLATGAWLKEQGRKELRPVIERLQTELDAEREHRKRNEAAIHDYQSELSNLRNRPVSRQPVRLCVGQAVYPDVATVGTAGTTATTGRSDGQTGSDPKAGPDIGPELRDLAYQCDAENAKLRALQNWITGYNK